MSRKKDSINSTLTIFLLNLFGNTHFLFFAMNRWRLWKGLVNFSVQLLLNSSENTTSVAECRLNKRKSKITESMRSSWEDKWKNSKIAKKQKGKIAIKILNKLRIPTKMQAKMRRTMTTKTTTKVFILSLTIILNLSFQIIQKRAMMMIISPNAVKHHLNQPNLTNPSQVVSLLIS